VLAKVSLSQMTPNSTLEPMHKTELQRFIQSHRAYASAIQGHLARLWRRPLSAEEINVIESYTLCGSLMSLESIERGLSLTQSDENASQEFTFMESEVAKHAEGVVREVLRRLGLGPGAPKPEAFPNLLAWEESLLEVVA
jgi:hypothetical protein